MLALKVFLSQDNKKAQFLRFALVGVIAAAVHYAIYFVCYHLMQDNLGIIKNAMVAFEGSIMIKLLHLFSIYGVAYTIGYFLSFILNFYLSSLFTFRSKATTKKGVGFAGAHLVNYLMHMGLFEIFFWIGVPEALIPIPVMSIAVPVNFFLVRFVFKH